MDVRRELQPTNTLSLCAPLHLCCSAALLLPASSGFSPGQPGGPPADPLRSLRPGGPPADPRRSLPPVGRPLRAACQSLRPASDSDKSSRSTSSAPGYSSLLLPPADPRGPAGLRSPRPGRGDPRRTSRDPWVACLPRDPGPIAPAAGSPKSLLLLPPPPPAHPPPRAPFPARGRPGDPRGPPAAPWEPTAATRRTVGPRRPGLKHPSPGHPTDWGHAPPAGRGPGDITHTLKIFRKIFC